ncbi:D-Ala-D-Ala carboxypeptidase family metallohydrolase [Comamonadaceae bacterium M7527]|nr:D-Ala-D-Ala carboxypeptidase family metallohydrolase [Comamonadaceae bacterium M7527]
MTKLTRNFSLEEMTKSETALRHGLDNTPSPEIVACMTELAGKVLQPVRDHFGMAVHVNSGYRSVEVNAKVGGSPTSEHCKGMAADIEIPGLPNHELAEWIAEHLKFTQLILEFYTPGVPDSGWVHVSFDPDNLKCQKLTAMRDNGRTVYRNGLVA